jgi:hypothetical protein
MPRLSLSLDDGEYEQVENPASVNLARAHFLRAVAEIEPKVLRDLGRETSSAFLRLPAEFRFTVSQYEPCLEELFDALRCWGSRWHLDEEWCLNQAFETLRYWEETGDFDNWDGVGISFRTSASPDERRFIFEHTASDLTARTRRQIRDEICKALKRELEVYLDRMECLARERGFTTVPNKFTSEHYEWLVYFQVKGHPYEKIRLKYSMISSPQAIQKAIKQLAAFIGLPLREDRRRPGRPAASSQLSE